MFKIFTSEEFDKDFEKLDNSIQKRIEKEIKQLEQILMWASPSDLNFFEKRKLKNIDFTI